MSISWKTIRLNGLLIVGLFSFFSLVQAQNGPGSTGAVELKIPVGPRAIAMGQAFVAVADDANAVYWNPAGLDQLGGWHITAQYDVYIETVQYDYFAIATKASKDIGLGLAAKILSTGTDTAVDANGNPVPGQAGPGENYFDVDLAGSYHLSYNWSLGLTGKYISKTLSGTNASTFAFDLGALYHTPIKNLTAGINLQNWTSPLFNLGLKYNTSDPLPFNVKVGASYRMFNDDFTVDYDMNFPNDNAISANLGGEYWYKGVLVGRFGYQFQGSIDQNQYGIGAIAGLYLGAGVQIKAFSNTHIGLDYAWTDTGFLGSNHHFALDLYF